jgi:DNA-binding MarR family transcriptional regulator
MAASIFFPRKATPHEVLERLADRYPEMDLTAVETMSALLRVAAQILNMTDEQLSKHKTSRGKISLLFHLNRDPGIPSTPSEIADNLGVTRATITGLLDGLERDGMIAREAGDDARSINVRLTPKGKKFLEDLLPDRYKKVRALMKGLTEADRKALQKLVSKIESGLPQYAGK